MISSKAILLMAYGSPETLEDVKSYYTDVRRGNPPDDFLLDQLKKRYIAVGGKTPLLSLTLKQAGLLQKKIGIKTYVGMKHWHPYIKETVDKMIKDGVREIVGLVLAPHYSVMSIADYEKRLSNALSCYKIDIKTTFIKHWGNNKIFIDSICERVKQSLSEFPVSDFGSVIVVFTAHSLPKKIIHSGDPYKKELEETCDLVVKKLGIPHFRFAFQSAGKTRDEWLGPDILQELYDLSKTKYKQILIVPIGFTTDNLEILYDLDIQALHEAKKLNLNLKRISSANTTVRFIQALEDVVCPFLS